MKILRLFLVLFVTLFISACMSTNIKPDVCKTAIPYNGAALYPAPKIYPIKQGNFDGVFDQAVQNRLNTALDKAMLATKAKSMTVTIGVAGTGLWTSKRTADGIERSEPMHYWASGGKTLTAITTLKFIEDGRLSLSDPVSDFIANVPNGDIITVEMLLNHTSGLYSINEDEQVRRQQENLSLEEIIKVLNRHGPLFCPGENWRYTNTGYGLLGNILELVDGRPYHEIVTATIIEPLELQNIRILHPNDPANDVSKLYSSDPNVPALRINSAGAAGAMVASSKAVVELWQAVLDGKILKQTTIQSMYKTLYPMFGKPPYYGLGVMLYEVPEPNGKVNIWIGHSGGAPGVRSVFAYVPSQAAFVAVALSGDGSAAATAYLLLNAIGEN